MKAKLIPEKNPLGYVGCLLDSEKAIYFFHISDGKGGVEVITRTKDTMESRYEQLIQPFRFFNKKGDLDE